MKDFFQTLLKPDWDDNPKKSEILLAANKLEVGEFQFLQLAYKEWHGHELPKTLVDNIFRGYTIRNNIPNWARHYARKIVHLDKVNKLNPQDPKYHVYDVEFGKPIGSKGLSKFIFSVLGITVFFLISFYLAIITVDEPATLLPPYFEKKNIYPELYKKENNKKK